MSKNTPYIFTLLILSLLVMASTITIVQGNTQDKTITFNTGGKVGYLKYYEQYYSINTSGQLVLDQERMYYNGTINNSKVNLLLTRPLTKEGTLYPEERIKAIAILNDEIILNAWYIPQTSVNNNPPKLEHPEILAGIITAIIIVIFVVILKLRKRKTQK